MKEFRYFVIVGFVLISLLGILGNSFTIYVFKPRRGQTRLKQMNLLIFYLAVIDLISSILNPTLFLYWEFTNHSRWDFGKFLCTVLPSFRQISIVVSLGMILLITMERGLIITNFRRVHLTCRKINIFVFFIILSSVLTEFNHILRLNETSNKVKVRFSCSKFRNQFQNVSSVNSISEVRNTGSNSENFLFSYTTFYTCDQIKANKPNIKYFGSNPKFRFYKDLNGKHINRTLESLLKSNSNIKCKMFCKPIQTTCELHTTQTAAYINLCIVVIRYSIALTILVVCNVFIYKTFKNKERRSFLKEQSHSVRPTRVLRLLIAMAVAFFCLVLPKEIFDAVCQFLSIKDNGGNLSILADINLFLALLQTTNFVCNVFIYARLHRRFKTTYTASLKRISLRLTFSDSSNRSHVNLIELRRNRGKSLP